MKFIYRSVIVASLCATTIFTASNAQKVLMETDKGNIQIELDPENAPITCENFMRYVDQKKYDGAIFYRVVRLDNQPDNKVKIEVIQGGVKDDTTKNLPPIFHETTKITGLKHLKGTLSMARTAPGTADSEFFICVTDQQELDFGGKRNADGQGFAAFGKVISGMETVNKIQSGQTGSSEAAQTLKEPVKIIRMERIK
ncbi:peptidyl-prolyl cis-trans isomerase A (cyclophilin A) [Dyadobacter koreensis]|uniref:Peptidyl-prolyl cis-trans isomerase n=1 Tax=Dyadobacter koreensis TaxID=408657 RepID=A0A1H6V4P1_9BACT|nr:peptidylprolyl isomerase [Dyadobacter koreensis]SEI95272.1 peptidyl-prolyl cis-trans isomerase A (cyclophilin A) [Dyadobacter koreensis]